VRCEETRQPAQIGIHQVLDAALADACQIGDRGREQIRRQGNRLAMKVAAGNHFARVGEHQRIIRGGVHLAFRDLDCMIERPRNVPCTCGMQRMLYASWTLLQSAWETMISECSSSFRRLAAQAICPGCGRIS